ncbi:potassium channel family protein [Chelatococcus sambhunathii]|uniref:potassium channel family protein n=1 Tax=Chelatococcus sambhunathii TaxID=363953 RepID=UPI002852CF63|nr:potassium channel family protein [Chelatococcus sambhunathii]
MIHGVAGLFGRRRGAVLSFAGPLIVVSLIGFWALGLTVGAALIIRPDLGGAIRPSNGGTPTDFVTALLVAGNSLSIVGGGDYSPHTAGTRILFLINSLIGASVLSLVLSYLVQVYSALRERNTLALTIHLMTDGTGDAAVMLARLMPQGEASDGPCRQRSKCRPWPSWSASPTGGHHRSNLDRRLAALRRIAPARPCSGGALQRQATGVLARKRTIFVNVL